MKHVTVRNLTLNLWLDFVKCAVGSDIVDERLADEIDHCMTAACFNSHQTGKYAAIDEAAQTVYQMDVSIKYRKETAEQMKIIRAALAEKIIQSLISIKAAD